MASKSLQAKKAMRLRPLVVALEAQIVRGHIDGVVERRGQRQETRAKRAISAICTRVCVAMAIVY
jgi:hypothetical protein